MYATILASADGAFVAEMEGRIVGEADASGGWIDVGVEPEVRRRGIGTALLRGRGGRDRRADAAHGTQSDPPGAAFARANGYEKAWEVWLMGIDLPEEIPEPEWPEGVSVRTYGGEEAEAREIKDLLDLAYAEEFHHQPATFENWSRFMFEDPMFDARSGFSPVRTARSSARPSTGTRATSRISSSTRTGAGAGSGRRSSTRPSPSSSGAGYPATLKTDSNNPTDAWRLYERVGMSKERTYEIFQKGSV